MCDSSQKKGRRSMQGISEEKKVYTVWSRNHHAFNYGEQVIIHERDEHGRYWVRPAYNKRAQPCVMNLFYLWSDDMGYNQGTEYK